MKIFLVIFLIGISVFSPWTIYASESDVSKAQISEQEAKTFAESFSKEVLTILQVKEGDNLSLDDRMKNFLTLLHEGVAMRSIGRASVGRFWDLATDEEKEKFHGLFESFFADVYAAHFKSYIVTNIEVTGTKVDDGGIWVTTLVSQKDKPDIRLDWKVVKGKDSLKIINVVVDQFLNFSMNLQKVFVEIIANNGGSFQAILDELEKKNTLGELSGIKK